MTAIADERSKDFLDETWRAALKRRLNEIWASLAAKPDDRHVPGTMVAAFAGLIVVIIASIFSIRSGQNMAFPDAQSHLMIARRITDSLAPGFTQLGTAWLPLPQLVLLPFVQSDWLWHTGWSGAILGALSMMGIPAGVYRIAARLGIGRTGRIIAVVLLLTNLSLIYESTTAMTEPLLLMFLVASVAGLTRWTLSERELSAGELMIFAGLPAAAAALSRFEGWAAFMAGTVVAGIVGWRKHGTIRNAVKIAAAYAVWPLMAISWYMAYTYAVYGNALEFANGQFSAFQQQVALSEAGFMSYQGHPGLTVWTFSWALAQTTGVLLCILGILGSFALAWSRGIRNEALMVGLMLVPSAFILFSMYVGQTTLGTDHSVPPNLINVRYTISAVPAFAVLGAVFVHSCWNPKWLRIIVVSGVILGIGAQSLYWMSDLRHSSVYAEGDANTVRRIKDGSIDAVTYLREHYDGGSILIDETASGNAYLPEIGIPLREYYNRSTGDLFTKALKDPSRYVRWVFMLVPDEIRGGLGYVDAVYTGIGNEPEFLAKYALEFSDGGYRIFRRIGE